MTVNLPPYICTALSNWRTPVRLERPAGGLRAFGWVLLGLSVGLVIVAVASPPHVVSWLASDVWLFDQTLDWLGANSRRFDLTHVVLFSWVGFLLSSMRWYSPWWQTALPLLGFALATELVQFLVPGRAPQVSDLYDDVLGIMSGVVLATALRWFVQHGSLTPGERD